MSTTATGEGKCGLSSFFPMSCRDRAEAFARHLNSRLRSLGSEDGRSANNETSWLTTHENPVGVAVAQPRHVNENNLYLNLELIESPGSPEEEEISEREEELSKFFTNARDNLQYASCGKSKLNNGDVSTLETTKGHSQDSDDLPYFDTEDVQNDINNYLNGHRCYPEGEEGGDEEARSDENPNKINEMQIKDDEFSTFNENSKSYPNEETKKLDSDDDFDSNVISKKCQDVDVIEVEIKIRNDLKINGHKEEEEHILNQLESKENFYENSIKVECQQTTSSEENRDCLLDNPDLTKYTSFCSGDKELSVDCTIKNAYETIPSHQEQQQQQQQQQEHLLTVDENEEQETRIPRVRRCSSLKSGKTPPETPGRKKIVRFADVLGLDLADVRTFLDEIPKIPVSAYDDLLDVEFNSSQQIVSTNLEYVVSSTVLAEKLLMPLFQQPGGQPDFLDRVREKYACLENAMVKDPIDLSITGTVRVRNLDFNKSVHIRYTIDEWKTFADLQATYVPNSCDGFSDKFSFLLYAHTLSVGQSLQFAIRFQCKGYQFWDNNNGVNYIFQCLPGSNRNQIFSSGPAVEETWGSSFYYANSEKTTTLEGSEVELSPLEVQNYINQSLDRRKKKEICSKSDVIVVAIIITISILFLYIYR